MSTRDLFIKTLRKEFKPGYPVWPYGLLRIPGDIMVKKDGILDRIHHLNEMDHFPNVKYDSTDPMENVEFKNGVNITRNFGLNANVSDTSGQELMASIEVEATRNHGFYLRVTKGHYLELSNAFRVKEEIKQAIELGVGWDRKWSLVYRSLVVESGLLVVFEKKSEKIVVGGKLEGNEHFIPADGSGSFSHVKEGASSLCAPLSNTSIIISVAKKLLGRRSVFRGLENVRTEWNEVFPDFQEAAAGEVALSSMGVSEEDDFFTVDPFDELA